MFFKSRLGPQFKALGNMTTGAFIDARGALLKHFGFTDFREGQAEVIESVIDGTDCVVVMPTGGGKSLCYQLPAVMMEGVALVVSPLIALMKDQVDALSARGIPTTFINSSLSYSELSNRLTSIQRGRFKMVYVAPERFRNEAFERSIAGISVGLFAVDEAHCISRWGHDFRPDYTRLRQAAEGLGRPQIIALTATATPQVRDDIVNQLGLRRARIFVAGFDRPNLALRVVHVKSQREKLDILKGVVSESVGSGIIYAATRKGVEQISSRLKVAGFQVEPYHAGLSDQERTRAQDKFMSGGLQAIIATNAFGMGIDKPDIRFVVHYHVPGSVEAYYQEVGRAGRDGLPADCILLFNYADTRTQQFFIEGSHPAPELIVDVYSLLTSMGGERINLSPQEIAAQLGIKNEMAVNTALLVLEKAGHIERGRSGNSTAQLLLKVPVEVALTALQGDSTEGQLLRDLIFNFNLNEREATKVNLSDVSQASGASLGQTRRSISRLADRGLIGHSIGFTGEGVRVLEAGSASVPLLDRRELAARATAEQWKLRRMVDYCYHSDCLRRFILNYFGDRKRLAACYTCSSCANKGTNEPLGQAGGQSSPRVQPMSQRHQPEYSEDRVLTEQEVVIARKILSCVARMDDRFGKGTVAAVLRGSKSKQVSEHGLDRLSTYGLLSSMSQAEVNNYIKALIDAGCILVRQGMYPTVRLSEIGRRVMKGNTEVTRALPLYVRES